MLYDSLKVALADPKRRLKRLWNEKDPAARAWLHQLYNKMSIATRFDLDDTFVQLTEEASLIAPAHLVSLYERSRAPYDITWVEWDARVRHEALQKWAGNVEPPELKAMLEMAERGAVDHRSGLLIERETRWPDRESVYRLSSYTFRRPETPEEEATGLSVIGWPVGIMWDPTGASVNSMLSRHDKLMNDYFKEVTRRGDLKSNSSDYMVGALGIFWMLRHSEKLDKSKWEKESHAEFKLSDEDETALNMMTDSMAYTSNGAFGHWILERWAKIDVQTRRYLVEECTGDIRFVTGILGLMNTFDVIREGPLQIPHGSTPRIINLKRVPYMEYHRLTLKLPKAKPIEDQIPVLGHTGIKKRAHLVRGFYRTYRKYGTTTWVKSHQRGDAGIGFVHKDYNVEGDSHVKHIHYAPDAKQKMDADEDLR